MFLSQAVLLVYSVVWSLLAVIGLIGVSWMIRLLSSQLFASPRKNKRPSTNANINSNCNKPKTLPDLSPNTTFMTPLKSAAAMSPPLRQTSEQLPRTTDRPQFLMRYSSYRQHDETQSAASPPNHSPPHYGKFTGLSVPQNTRADIRMPLSARAALGTYQKRQPSTMIRHSQTLSTYCYLFVLSISDLLLILIIPMLVVNLHFQWVFGWLPCKIFLAIECLNKCLSPLILTVLSIDRFIAVCMITWHRLREPLAIVGLLSICALISGLFAAPILYYSDTKPIPYENETIYMCHVNFEDLKLHAIFDVFQFVVCYMIPLIIISSVYTAILVKIWRHTRQSTAASVISVSRVAKSSAMVVGFYFFCWTPYYFCRMIEIVLPQGPMTLDTKLCRPMVPLQINGTNINVSTSSLSDIDDSVAELFGFNTTGPTTTLHPCEEEMYLEDQTEGWWLITMFGMHCLPYAQAAFNWLFYAYLNKNLRQSSNHSSTGIGGHVNHAANGAASWLSRFGSLSSSHRPRVQSDGSKLTLDRMNKQIEMNDPSSALVDQEIPNGKANKIKKNHQFRNEYVAHPMASFFDDGTIDEHDETSKLVLKETDLKESADEKALKHDLQTKNSVTWL